MFCLLFSRFCGKIIHSVKVVQKAKKKNRNEDHNNASIHILVLINFAFLCNEHTQFRHPCMPRQFAVKFTWKLHTLSHIFHFNHIIVKFYVKGQIVDALLDKWQCRSWTVSIKLSTCGIFKCTTECFLLL